MKFRKIFQLLTETFEKERIDHALIGAFMKSPGKSRMAKSLDLERDLLLTEEDLRYMEKSRFDKTGGPEIVAYIDFLEEIWAFKRTNSSLKVTR